MTTTFKRPYNKLSHLTEEELKEYKNEQKKIYRKRYMENHPDRVCIQSLNSVKKWYEKEENKRIKCLKNKMRWYLLNIKKLEEEQDKLNSRQLKRLETLKNMLNDLITNHPEIMRTHTEQDDNKDTN